MIGHIYYIFGLLIILSIISIIANFNKFYSIEEWHNKFKKVTGKYPEKKEFRNSEEYNLKSGISILSYIEFTWLLLGILTSSWYMFISLFIYIMIVSSIIKPVRFNVIGKIVSFHLVLVRFSIYLFLVINHFHLHIDVLSIVVKSLHL